MCEFIELIQTHFAGNDSNPIHALSIESTSGCGSNLESFQNILSPKPVESFLKKAKGELAALALNVVSGKLAQWEIVSTDSASTSQALTYCSSLISDQDDGNDNGIGHAPESLIPAFQFTCNVV